jgi:hypothetical protein
MARMSKQAYKRVLHVGCGWLNISHMSKGFQDGTWSEVRFDIDPNMAPDVVGTITDMSAVSDASVDALYSSHNIEHVETHQVARMFKEFYRVLTPNGFAAINCPDLQSIGEIIASGKQGLNDPLYMSSAGPISLLDVIYGYGADIAAGRHYMAHRTGYNQSGLSTHLRKAGFPTVLVRRRPQRHDLWAIASKRKADGSTMVDLMTRYGAR